MDNNNIDEAEKQNRIRELELQIEELKLRNQTVIIEQNQDRDHNQEQQREEFDGINETIKSLLLQSQVPKEAKKMSQKRKGLLKAIQYENVNRLFGITSFKITNDSNNDFLGLRFDIFNAFKHQYVIPHYIILRKQLVSTDLKTSNSLSNAISKWTVFKSTLPKYIPFNELALDYLPKVDVDDLQDKHLRTFGLEVYEQLNSIESKRSQVQYLNSQCLQKYPNLIHIRFDLNVHKINISIKDRIELILIMNLNDVLSAVIIDEMNLISLEKRRGVEQVLIHCTSDELASVILVSIDKLLSFCA